MKVNLNDKSGQSSSSEEKLLLVRGGKRSSSERVILTLRDYKLMRFILEMKFASTEVLFERFFKTTLSGETATSPEFMRRRLLALERAGLLKRWKPNFGPGLYYVATLTTRRELIKLNGSPYYPNPQLNISMNTFDHDLKVQLCRFEFEKTLGIRSWTPEQVLRSTLMRDFKITPGYCPDGIYELPNHDLIAFELEISMKDKKRYSEKLRKQDRAMRDHRDEVGMFKRVHYRCTTERVYNMLKDEIQYLSRNFDLELVRGGFINPGQAVSASSINTDEASNLPGDQRADHF